MDTKDKWTIVIAIAAFCVSCIAVFVSIKSCSIAEDQAERYYEEIKYIGERDIKKNLTIKQISGSKYFLKEVELVPTFVGISGSLYEEGTRFELDLNNTFKGDEKGYFIDDIQGKICIYQEVKNCGNRTITELKMSYKINDKVKHYNIPFLMPKKAK